MRIQAKPRKRELAHIGTADQHSARAAQAGDHGRVAAAFPADLLARLKGAGAQSDMPVFVIGMPRSGTTLIEQIL
ncbi:sulfotransferase, partial [Paraburkholderia sp. Ac-20340]|uniref:sulfotransferase n=1 Tax=Paraburkholderia sp. Ac-20340 TaxID=2703888 RepID=UPI001F1205DD